MNRLQSARSEVVLPVILLVSLLLRIYGLGEESIWIDEVFSVKLANLGLEGIVEETSKDVHTPFYYFILHYWVSLFGDSEFSIRFPSVISGSFAVFMIYKVGRLLFDEETGIFGSLILGLSVFHIFYSQEARMYSLMSLLTLLSFYFFIRLFKERSIMISTGYALSSALLIYAHYFGLFIIIAENIYAASMFLLKKNDKLGFKRWCLLQVVLALLFAPWILVLARQVMEVQSGYWIPTPGLQTLVESFKLYSGPYLLPLFLVMSALSVISRRRPGHIGGLSSLNRVYLLLLWLLVPIMLPFIASKISTPIYYDRYTIGASAAFYILAASGIGRVNNRYLKPIIITAIIVFSSVSLWGYYTSVNKEQWRELAHYIDANAKSKDLILFHAGTAKLRDSCQFSFDYYSERANLVKKPFPEENNDVQDEDIKLLKSISKSESRIWVIVAYTSEDNTELIKETLIALNFNKIDLSQAYSEKIRPGIGVYLFERR